MTTPAPPDPWSILHLPRTASPSDIKRAYRRLLLIYHPDKQRDAGDDRVIQLTEAYRLLTDPEARESYERDGDVTRESHAAKRARNPTRTISLDLFTYHPPGASPLARDAYYTHPCRCSGVYTITERELEAGVDVVGCEGCGEWVGVGYEVVDDEDEELMASEEEEEQREEEERAEGGT